MKNFTYSIIIPHKNSSDLLQRCIASIPQRDDVQIIVVDDNSDENKKPSIEQQNVAIVYLDAANSKGAGHARNLGLSYATGQWVLFIDADDTYGQNINHLLDTYGSSNFDVIYFGYDKIRNDKKQKGLWPSLDDTANAEDVFRIKFGQTVPWNKMVRRRLIERHNIRFEECPVGNDIFFTYQVGYFCGNNFTIASEPVYNYFINDGSITHRKKNSEQYYLTICKHIYQCNAFYHFMGCKRHPKNMIIKLAAIWKKKGLGQSFFALRVYMKHYSEIRRERLKFVELIKDGKSI